MKPTKNNFTDYDLEYMSSLNTASHKTTTQGSRIFIWAVTFMVVGSITWMAFAQIDEITKGDGKVIPSTHLRTIQHLEGGVVESIHVKEGDSVEAGDLLIKLSNIKPASEVDGNQLKTAELEAKRHRLSAEAHLQPLTFPKNHIKELAEFIPLEEAIYTSNKNQLINKINILNEQLNQKISEFEAAKSNHTTLSSSLSLILSEEKIAQEMLASGAESKVEYLKLQRERNDIQRSMQENKNSIVRINHAIAELKAKMLQEKIDYQTVAKQELSKTYGELEQNNILTASLSDKMNRTQITAPVKGVIKQMFMTTPGGVVRPGMDLIEMIPTEDSLLIETKIKPSDIAFIRPKQKAIVKFSAYDFSIYGGMVGEVTQISSDTIVDQQKQESYYLVKVKIDQHAPINSKLSHVDIIPGMTASVDVVTGKKTVLQYLLKPIIKARQNALTEK